MTHGGRFLLKRTLIVDNYDSFTYNLVQLVAAATGIDPIVICNDALSERELRNLDFDAVILSPDRAARNGGAISDSAKPS